MKSFLIIILVGAASLCAQSDWVKWESKQVPYELPTHPNHDYTIDKSGFGMTILSTLRNAYYFFISDLDGANCAFSPSCSAFFLDAVKETNILKGTLMFADRFTRDINFFKGANHYSLLPSKKYLDPAINYTLQSEKIKL